MKKYWFAKGDTEIFLKDIEIDMFIELTSNFFSENTLVVIHNDELLKMNYLTIKYIIIKKDIYKV